MNDQHRVAELLGPGPYPVPHANSPLLRQGGKIHRLPAGMMLPCKPGKAHGPAEALRRRALSGYVQVLRDRQSSSFRWRRGSCPPRCVASSGEVPGRRIANSSPPNRATWSVLLRWDAITPAIVDRTTSPTGCPYESFTRLELSMSSNRRGECEDQWHSWRFCYW